MPSIREAIDNAIAAPDYRPPLPKLDVEVWNKVLDWKTNKVSNDSLEWLGDGLIYAAISVEVHRQLPRGTPDMFTRIRGPIVTNKTFASITHKLNISGSVIHIGSNAPLPTSKRFADVFEVIPAEIYLRGGFEVLRDWVGTVFGPLISAAIGAYERHPPLLNRKRKNMEEEEEFNKRRRTDYADPTDDSLRRYPYPAGLVNGKSQVSAPALSSSMAYSSSFPSSRQLAESAALRAGGFPSSGQSQQPRVVPYPTSGSMYSTSRPIAVMSQSHYTAGGPSAPACGPGSSRFDPIVIDLDEEAEVKIDLDKTSAQQREGPHREVIEILDDDDGQPVVEKPSGV